jgi:hypothetical protein
MRIRKILRRLIQALHPRLLPAVDWLSPAEVWAATRDGGAIFFPLDNLSHIASHGKAEPGQDPGELPAELHMKNGTFYVMAAPAGSWIDRIRKTRLGMLEAAFDLADDEPRSKERENPKRDSGRPGRAV